MKYIILVIAIAIFLFVLYALCSMSGNATEAEERIHLDAWRKGLQRGDLARSGGITYRIESNDGRVCECRTYSDEKFILLGDLWPVD